MGGVKTGVAIDSAQLRLLKNELSTRELVPSPVPPAPPALDDEASPDRELVDDEAVPPWAAAEPPCADAVPTAAACAALEALAFAPAEEVLVDVVGEGTGFSGCSGFGGVHAG
jgi:hypothetical protein